MVRAIPSAENQCEHTFLNFDIQLQNKKDTNNNQTVWRTSTHLGRPSRAEVGLCWGGYPAPDAHAAWAANIAWTEVLLWGHSLPV